MKHLLTLSYFGTAYNGFQVQPNGDTVQARLQTAAETIFASPCGVTGCSRTDSGVHANTYLAVIEEHGTSGITEDAVPRAMNTYLPADIAVKDSRAVPDSFAIRREVLGKEYVYRIWNAPIRNPFAADRAFFYPRPLSLERMNEAAHHFIGTHDFRAFMASGSDICDTVRTITDLHVSREGDFLTVTVSADGFLYNMVRILVGTLIEVSEGKIAAEEIPAILASGERERAGRTAPAHGLYLNRIFLKQNGE